MYHLCGASSTGYHNQTDKIHGSAPILWTFLDRIDCSNTHRSAIGVYVWVCVCYCRMSAVSWLHTTMLCVREDRHCNESLDGQNESKIALHYYCYYYCYFVWFFFLSLLLYWIVILLFFFFFFFLQIKINGSAWLYWTVSACKCGLFCLLEKTAKRYKRQMTCGG